MPALMPLLPKSIGTYCEPFMGGAAMLFSLQPRLALVNDINSELINVYEVIRHELAALIAELKTHRNEKDHFYAVRDWDRDPEFYNGLPPVRRAARLLYLNKTCYNGLFRVNSAGEFNTPFGSYKNPCIVNEPVLYAVSKYFNTAQITFSSQHYAEVLSKLPKGSFVYLDPPYDPLSSTANFTSYSKVGFGREEQTRLRDCCDDLHTRGIKFMLSNSSTDFIKELYARYNISIVQAKRAVNSVATRRGTIDEVVVRNYG